MSFDGQSLQHIQVENVIDYAQYINQVAGLDAGLQGLHSLQSLPDGTTVAFIEASIFDASQILDNGAIEVQTLGDGSTELQQQVVLEPAALQQITVPTPVSEPQDVKPPIGKGPFNCTLCDKVFTKWNQLQRHMKTHDEDKPFRCTQCPQSFNIESNLLLHLATHVGPDQDPRCPECGKKFSRVASLKAHIMLHEKEESLMCPECGDEFTVQHQLDKHMETHRSDSLRVHACRQCNQEFTKMSALKEHMKEHYKVKASLSHRSYKRNLDRSGFTHKCKHCTKTFQKPSQLERHERIHTGERPFECMICQRTFNQKGALQMHMAKHTGSRPHKCSFCPQSFSQKGNLRAHIQRVHTLNKADCEVVYKCEECSCMFRRLGSLNAHISRAHADHGDSGQTTVQDIKTPLPLGDITDTSIMPDMMELDHVGSGTELGDPSLGDGQVLHGSLDQGASDILQQALENSGLQSTVDDDQDGDGIGNSGASSKNDAATLSSASSGGPAVVTVTASTGQPSLPRQGTMAVHDSATGMLKRHYIRKVNGIRWHQCTYCTKEFKKPSDLVRHIRIHTHEKPYKCSQCFSAFAVKSTLTAHVKTHTGVKEFCCEVCNKMFSTQGSLKVHVRLHTGAKPFSCTHCDKKFRTSAHCKSHIMSHFKDPDSKPRSRRPFKREQQQSSLLAEIPLQEPILITDSGLIQQPPRNNGVFPPYANESGNSERPYRCQHCRRGFKKSSHLKQHIRSHTGEKPFRCNLCLRSFVSGGVLKAHARTHSGLKSFKCVVCDTMFTTSGSLKRHMSTHSEVRPFMCPYCQKTFKTSVNCKKHMKTHRHELAMQHYRNVNEGQDGGEEAEEETREEEEVEVVEDVNMQASQTIADLRTVQQLDLRHPVASELQVVEMSQGDLQAAGVTAEALSLDGGLSQSFGQGMFGQNFTLVGQQQFVQLGQTQEGETGQQADDALQRVTVQLEGTGGADAPTTQFTYQPQNWKAGVDGNQNQETTIHIINNGSTLQQETGQGLADVEEEDGDAMDQLREDGEIVDSGLLGAISAEGNAGQTDGSNALLSAQSQQASSVPPLGRRGFRCQICNKMFKRSGHLSQHMRLHTNSKYLRCPECPKSFSSAAVLRGHLRVHQGLQAHLCSICNAAFSTPGALRKHMVQHNGQPMLTGAVGGLEAGEEATGVIAADEYTCVLCNQQFRNAAQLRRHVKDCQVNSTMPETTVITLRPNDENRAPKRGTQRRRPVVQQFVSEEQVSISEKILIESASEKDRISMPKEVENQSIKRGRFANMCPHCPKSFKKPSDLQRHMRIHTGEKPFSCHICNRSFTVKSTLDSHLKTHGASKKMFVCHVCQSLFSTKGSLKVHMRLHTGAKPFKCMHCDQRFRTSGHRKSHMVSHFKTEGVPKKKPIKTTAQQPLVTASQNASVPQQAQQAQQQILCLFTKDNAGQPTGNQQVLAMDPPMAGQVIGVDQGLGNQVINVDQSLLQNQALVPVQLTVNDTGTMDTQALPTQINVPQGLDNNGLQLHIAPLGQFNQGFQISGMEQGFLQQAVQIDASLLQQLQQNGFITINPNGIQPNITADLSQVGGDIGANIVLSAAASSSVSTDSLINQQALAGTGESLLRHQGLQDTDGSNADAVLGQTIQVSEAFLNQLRSEGLMVQTGAEGITAMSQQQQQQQQHQQPQPGSSNTVQMIGSHRISDTLLSQQPHRLHRPGVDALIGQSSHTSQENYLHQAAAHGSDTIIGQDRLNGTDALIGRQISYGDAIGAAGDHGLIHGMQLTHVSSLGDLQAHQLTKTEADDIAATTYITQQPGGQSQQQDLSLNKIAEVDEDDKLKYMLPGDDQRIVAISALDHQAAGLEQEDDEAVGDQGSQEQTQHQEDQVDTTALIPTAEVSGVEKQQDRTDRHHICGICYKGFKRATHLRDHMATHGAAGGQAGATAKKAKTTPHTCMVCFKAFQKPSQLERHMRIHTGERPFMCEICSKAFNQKNALQVHLRKHSGEKPHICPYCPASFVQSGNLKTHVKRAHHTDMVSTMGFGQRQKHPQAMAAVDTVAMSQMVAAEGSTPAVSLSHEGQAQVVSGTLAVGDGEEEEEEDEDEEEEGGSKPEIVSVVGGLDMNDMDMFHFSYS